MKPSNNDLSSIHLSNQQRVKESKIADGGDNINPMPSISKKDTEQRLDDFGKTIAEEDKFNNLMQTGRDLAHQLNNLLTTILANTQLTSLISKEEELKPYLRSVEEATRDAALIVREFQGSIRELADTSSQEISLGGTQRLSK